jgi:hypothetical protein
MIIYFHNSMEQSPSWEANRSSASQEIPCILWNPQVYYRIDKRSSHIPFLTHISPVHAFTFHCLKIHFNIISHLLLGLLVVICKTQSYMGGYY